MKAKLKSYDGKTNTDYHGQKSTPEILFVWQKKDSFLFVEWKRG